MYHYFPNVRQILQWLTKLLFLKLHTFTLVSESVDSKSKITVKRGLEYRSLTLVRLKTMCILCIQNSHSTSSHPWRHSFSYLLTLFYLKRPVCLYRHERDGESCLKYLHIQSFITHIFIELLLSTRHCFRHWRYCSEQNRKKSLSSWSSHSSDNKQINR